MLVGAIFLQLLQGIQLLDIIKINEKEFSPIDFLFGDADRYAFEGKDLPAKVNVSIKAAGDIIKYGNSKTIEYDNSKKKLAASNANSTSRKLSHSKRKVIYTLSGPLVGVAVGVVTIVILGGPVTWVIVGGLAVAAAFSAVAGFAIKKVLRNTRAYYYEKRYITTQDGRKTFKQSHDALNGVRYVLKKRSVSVIADDVKDLAAAIREYSQRKNQSITSCREALELTYWYDRVQYLHERMNEEMSLFIQFYYYLHKELNTAFIDGPDAMNNENAGKAIQEINTWVSKPYSEHEKTCNSGFFHGTCYALGPNGKVVKPKITVFSSLSERARNPSNRLWGDAIHQCKKGEHSVVDTYEPEVLDVEKTKLFQSLTDVNTVVFDLSTLKPEGLSPKLKDLAHTDSMGVYKHMHPSNVNTATESFNDYSQAGQRLRGAVISSVVTTSIGAGGAALRQVIVPVASQAVGSAAASAGISGSLGAVAMVPLNVYGEVKNLRNEAAALEVELGKPVTNMDIGKMMTSLRTLLKDGNVFEKTVDEITKILKYYEEFHAAMSTPMQNCEQAFEKAYRIAKMEKHFKILQEYMPLYELFARIALNLNNQVDAIQKDADDAALKGKVKLWFDVDANHANCGHSGLCYHGIVE